MTGAGRKERGRVPKTIAVINADYCTGCEACIAVCPVDCIALVETQQRIKGVHSWCEVDFDRCIGCMLCVRLPNKTASSYELKVCPWDAIEMVPSEFLPQAVTGMGGPPDYVAANRQRLLESASRVAAARANQ